MCPFWAQRFCPGGCGGFRATSCDHARRISRKLAGCAMSGKVERSLACGLFEVRFAPDGDRGADIAEGPSCAQEPTFRGSPGSTDPPDRDTQFWIGCGVVLGSGAST